MRSLGCLAVGFGDDDEREKQRMGFSDKKNPIRCLIANVPGQVHAIETKSASEPVPFF